MTTASSSPALPRGAFSVRPVASCSRGRRRLTPGEAPAGAAVLALPSACAPCSGSLSGEEGRTIGSVDDVSESCPRPARPAIASLRLPSLASLVFKSTHGSMFQLASTCACPTSACPPCPNASRPAPHGPVCSHAGSQEHRQTRLTHLYGIHARRALAQQCGKVSVLNQHRDVLATQRAFSRLYACTCG